MKKQLISVLLMVSALSLASAQTASTTSGALPPITGDTTVDAQIRSLNQEMEAKIRAIRDDYQTRIKALIETRRSQASSTPNRPWGERRDYRGPLFGTTTRQRPPEAGNQQGNGNGNPEGDGNRPQEGSRAPQNIPQGNAWGFFQRFFGGRN